MRRIATASLSASLSLVTVAGLAAIAAPAHAGDVGIDVGVAFGDGHTRGFVGFGTTTPARKVLPPQVYGPHTRAGSPPFGAAPYGTPYTPAPAFPVSPAPLGGGHFDGDGCREFIPAHEVMTTETICEPAVYEDRCVPVFDTVCVPIFKEICVPDFQEITVPVYEERCVPILGRVRDPKTGRSIPVKVGERKEQVQVGERVERVKVGEHKVQVKIGERKERVQVGERTEHVLVRRETTRVVPHVEHVPGRFVTVVENGMPVRRHGPVGEVLTRSQFEREMALVPTGSRFEGGGRFGVAHR